MADVIFTTIHGSNLYGFAHAGSDHDTFTVTDSHRARARQTVDDAGNDRVVVGLDHFLDLVHGGSHQSVEALFSPVKEWADTPAADHYRPMLNAHRITGSEVFAKYERTIRAFAFGDYKRRRHAARLTTNLQQLRIDGTIRPRLSEDEARWCNLTADAYSGRDLERYLLP
ncbi:hypothetical protein [Microbacterium jejuense]|uniref:hypothetical protein n=1 Tax=Microbacterium jejuense TaxID=1263637 RepID=UPI0031E748A3